MAVDTTAAPPNAGRKIRRLGIAVAIVVALYSAGWFYLASKFETFLGQFVNQASPGDVSITCGKLSTGGFPFLIGFTCDNTVIDDQSTGNKVTAGPFRAAARIYNPGAAIVELEGPADFTLGDGSTVAARWKLLRSSLHANFSGLSQLSLEGDLPSLRLQSPRLYGPIDFKAKEGELHLRQNNGDLDLAAIANDFEWNDEGGNAILPKLSTSFDLTLIGKGALLEGKPLVTKAMKGELRAFKIETPDGMYGEMSGPFTIDDEGYITGTFRTTLEKLDLWDEKLRTIFPEAGDTISGMAALLKGLAKGEDKVTVKLKVDKGRISLSLLPLGKIPPI
ncbi:MAG: hypothetical protein JWM58_4339 [Rhizobium sp.]|nr:hypothetical protein [Rhizobium sp.]